ncbi:MAG: phosphoribosylglycinamide formyltransferase [Bacteroidota bacterium]|jgi:formyltetrahydrofolate-dependent phosphoribosylglycinamide formyltransferase|nr:phosphoribosylglycinamide formyltransferase [Ignavibacteria bacterium]MCU7494224.1 phosphoribosylglycinamide formyltransferase [Ignavibacteria bacterium]MCU7511919.1 phosphoribosylglycinamide formyltransferase [Ignavibacteria bacterium]MCU7520048.1 phosphoribosylglycinamide formyltransferase [Ignavibacteria bacterium]
MLKIAVFVSGRGSNLQAILDAKQSGALNVEVAAVFTDRPESGAVEKAKQNSIPVWFLSKEKKSGSVTNEELAGFLKELKVELVVLAGFLKLVPEAVIDIFENKVINIHPALLPSFGGKGMYGMNVHRAVFNSSAKISGPTVHFVDKIYDNGKIIAQRAVDISDVSSPEEIAERVLKIEHELLPFVIGKFSEGKIKIIDERVVVF